MSNSEIYWHFRLAGIDSPTATDAADAISLTLEDGIGASKPSNWLDELLQDFINLYGIDSETAFAELEKRLL